MRNPTIYESYPELEIERVFTPAEAAILSGVSTEKQRQHKHNGFAVFLEPRAGETKHTRYDFEDVALWALFAEVASYNFDLRSAGYFAASFSGRNGLPDAESVADLTHRRQILYYDFRRPATAEESAAPLYLFCYPQIGKPETFLNTSTGSGQISFDGTGLSAGRFGFWVNYSDFQRRLLMRYESIR